jgi:hypothetical protein
MVEAEFTLKEVAHAVGMKPSTLRSWLHRQQVQGENERGGPWGRVSYTMGDVLFFRLVVELSIYGVPVDRAFQIVRAAGDKIKAGLSSDDDFITEMVGHSIILWKPGSEWQWDLFTKDGNDLKSFIIIMIGECFVPILERLYPKQFGVPE